MASDAEITHDDELSDTGNCLCGECDAGTDRIDHAAVRTELDELIRIHCTPETQAWIAEWRARPGWWEKPAAKPQGRGQLTFGF